MKYPVIDLYDTTVAVWEERPSDDSSFRRRVFDPMVAHLRARGWHVGVDPTIAADYPSLTDTHLRASFGELLARLEIFGRVIRLEIWQETHNVSNPYGGRYDGQKRARMPYLLGLRCDAETTALVAFLREQTGYPVSDRRRDHTGTADERIARRLTGSGHFVPALGHAAWNSESNRTGAGGARLEHGQRVWCTDPKGRWVRGQAFYSLNNMWLVKVSPYAFWQMAAHELHAVPPADPRRKVNAAVRTRTLKVAIEQAVRAEDFVRAATLKVARDRQVAA